MSYDRVIKSLEKNRERRLNGSYNCLPWGLPKFEEFHPGIEQGKSTLLTANSKV